jgi:hypothetical protein
LIWLEWRLIMLDVFVICTFSYSPKVQMHRYMSQTSTTNKWITCNSYVSERLSVISTYLKKIVVVCQRNKIFALLFLTTIYCGFLCKNEKYWTLFLTKENYLEVFSKKNIYIWLLPNHYEHVAWSSRIICS